MASALPASTRITLKKGQIFHPSTCCCYRWGSIEVTKRCRKVEITVWLVVTIFPQYFVSHLATFLKLVSAYLPVLLLSSSSCWVWESCYPSPFWNCKVERVYLVGIPFAWTTWASYCACIQQQKYRTCNFKHSSRKMMDRERKFILNNRF